MATKSTVPVEEYLRMTFEGPDPEYLDGELQERHLGEDPHSATQGNLIDVFHELKRQGKVFVRPELHMRLAPTRIRVADLAIFTEKPTERIPTSPPLITIEIISRDDRLTEIREKCEDYRKWGVKHIWLADPQFRRFQVYDDEGLRDVRVFQLPEFGLEITPEQVFD